LYLSILAADLIPNPDVIDTTSGRMGTVYIFAANGGLGHTREVQGLHSLAAAFEDEADRRTLSFIPG
jgi:hypothetical protein